MLNGILVCRTFETFGKGRQELRNKFSEQMGSYHLFRGDWMLDNRGYQHFYTYGFKLKDGVVFGQHCNVLAHIESCLIFVSITPKF